MPKITISEPSGPYSCLVDTEAMEVTITDAFLGVVFETDEGQKLAVCMRDGGFEIHHFGHNDGKEFDSGWVEVKDGYISVGDVKVRKQEL